MKEASHAPVFFFKQRRREKRLRHEPRQLAPIADVPKGKIAVAAATSAEAGVKMWR